MPLQEPSSKSTPPLGLRAWAITLLEVCIGFCAAVACAELTLPSALAQAPVSDPDPSIIRRWVEDLGDRQFEVRDQATAKLSNLSNQQLELLKELLASSTDPEIIVRLSSVVAKLKAERQSQIVQVFLRETDIEKDHGLKGWSSFAKVAGSNRTSKRLFLQLYDRYPMLVEQPLDDPKQAAEFGLGIVRGIQQQEMGRNEPDKIDGLVLLYCSCIASTSDEYKANLAAMSLRVLLRAPYNQALRDPQGKRAIESMVEIWSQNIEGSYEQTIALQIMLEANLSTARSLAMRMLQAPDARSPSNDQQDPKDLLKAFQVFFRFGKPEDIPLLEKWLDNKEVCEELVSLNFPGAMQPPFPPNGQGPNQPNNPGNNPNAQRPLATVELRDVALLACMQIADIDYRDHFRSLRQSILWGYVPNSIALPVGSEAIREARLEAWKKARP
jgi:hypothetical protein